MKARAILIAAALAIGPALSAATITLNETLSGSQETPPNASPATGTGTETLDTATDLFTWSVSWSGLTSAFTAAHFHAAPPGVAGPVIIDLSTVGTLTIAPGGLSGSSTGSTTVTSTQAADIAAGLWYVNVHSAQFPAGEIRGQLVPTPEPATCALLGVGLLALARFRRRPS